MQVQENKNPAIRLENVTKSFGSVIANNEVNLDIRRGEILSLLGENGSGKTTLMNMLAGLYFPDSGHVYVDGEEVSIRSPKDSYNLGIGMIHQHFKLVDVFTAAENIALGVREKGRYNLREIKKRIEEICRKYGFEMNPDQKVYSMTVSQKQTLEIIKVLYRGADILILDEPTAVLTPQETEKLFNIIKNMRDDGKSIIIITHKLHEVLSVSDRVAILRRGEYIGDVPTSDATELRIVVRGLSCTDKDGIKVLDDISFTANSGEILGIAGISGCGQKELLEAIAGLNPVDQGSSIEYFAEGAAKEIPLIGKSPKQIRDLGISLSFVPEDRLGMGLVGSMGMTGNMMLKNYSEGHSPLADRREPKKLAENVREKLEVVTPDVDTPVRQLSGGNVQKVLVGREIASAPTVLMTAYAVRGLDINTSYTIYRLLNEQKKKGVCVIYVGEDLDVLLELCDRIMVLCSGKLNGIVDARTTTKEEVGLLMTNLMKEEK